MYYKWLQEDGRSPYAHCKWHLPTLLPDGTYKPGRWMPRIEGELVRCEVGYHGCDETQLVRWIQPTLYEMEYEGEPERDGAKCWGARARLVRPVPTWDERTARLFACDCAEWSFPLWERHHPNDRRPHEAVAVARRFANGEAGLDELRAARSAAHSAAWSAANSAADSAAYSAARSAAHSAAWSAANSAADSAAWSALNTILLEYVDGVRGVEPYPWKEGK